MAFTQLVMVAPIYQQNFLVQEIARFTERIITTCGLRNFSEENFNESQANITFASAVDNSTKVRG